MMMLRGINTPNARVMQASGKKTRRVGASGLHVGDGAVRPNVVEVLLLAGVAPLRESKQASK
jgi:hypothetical protein